MPRPRNVERKVPFNCWITEALRARMDLRLWDPVMGRIPFGAHGDLVERALTSYLDQMETPQNVQP